MAHKQFCLITPQEADLLREGINPCCSRHRHLSASEARLLINGAEKFPWLDPQTSKSGQITERYKPSAYWAILGDGSASTKYVVLGTAREWTASQQWLPIGTERRIKHGRTKCQRPIWYSATQCADVNFVPSQTT